MNKIPTYYHIPKCAGTYIVNLMAVHTNRYAIHNNFTNPWFHLMIIGDNHSVMYRIYTTRNNLDNCYHIAHNVYKTSLDNYIQNRNQQDILLGIIVEPSNPSWISAEADLDTGDKKFEKFMTIRQPFDRLCSFFNYLNNEASSHEKMHKKIPNNFDDFISSYAYEDSFLIRKLTPIGKNQEINIEWYSHCINTINKMNITIKDIKDSKLLIKQIYKECYSLQIDIEEIEQKNRSKIRQFFNRTEYAKNYSISELSLSSKNFLKYRTQYDQKLYDYYVNIP